MPYHLLYIRMTYLNKTPEYDFNKVKENRRDMKSKTILLNSRPTGTPTGDNFKLITEEVSAPAAGEVLLKTRYVSVDPYLRGRMNDAKSYIPPFELHKPFSSGIIAEVIDSRHGNYQQGDLVYGNLDWKEYQLSKGKGLQKIDEQLAPIKAYLSVLGGTGLTAYLGLKEIGKPKEGETVVISGAAGAVGSIAGQIAKLKGCRVVGTAGSDEKIHYLKEQLHFDAAINYKTDHLKEELKTACPDGVDVYFDNVGGEISDLVTFQINKYARIILCGQISMYNAEELPTGPRIQHLLVTNSALMQGFIISDFADQFNQARQQLGQWLKEGKLQYKETIKEGFDAIPEAFLGLFAGENTGKMIVKV